MGGHGLDGSGSRQGQVVSFCAHGDEQSGSIRWSEYLDKMRKCCVSFSGRTLLHVDGWLVYLVSYECIFYHTSRFPSCSLWQYYARLTTHQIILRNINVVCMYVCVHVCMYVCMYVCVCIYIYMYVCMYVRMYICMCVCMCVCRGGVWGWQVGRPPQALLLKGPRASGLWVCQAIFSGKLEMLIHAPFKILQCQIP